MSRGPHKAQVSFLLDLREPPRSGGLGGMLELGCLEQGREYSQVG